VAAPIRRGSRRARANNPCRRRPGTGCGRDAGWRVDRALDAERRHMETGRSAGQRAEPANALVHDVCAPQADSGARAGAGGNGRVFAAHGRTTARRL
jgi:hypothetical protein